MPGPSSPILDTWPPAQYASVPTGDPTVNTGQTQTYDNTLHYKLGGTILMALALVFVLQYAGFRFVVAGGIGR